MNRLNRIFHNKQIKLFWFLRSFARYLTPKRLLQSRLDRVLAEAGTPPRLGVHLPAGGLLQQTVACACDPPPRRAASVRRPQVPPGRQDGLFLRYLRVHPLVQRPPAVEYRSRGRDDGSRRAVDRQDRPICGDNANSVLLNLDKVRLHLPAGRHSVPEEVRTRRFSGWRSRGVPTASVSCACISVRSVAMQASRRPVPNIPRSGPNPIFRCTTT